jgi:ketosteroid isomerase-like protein
VQLQTAVVVVALAAAGPLATQSPVATAATEIRVLLDSSAAAWNRGDVRGHLVTNADSIWFMTKRGPSIGNDRVAEMMTQSYFREGQTRRTLRLDHVTVRPLRERFALTVGQFILSAAGQADQSGWFTTVWERRAEGWRVIHDHSS